MTAARLAGDGRTGDATASRFCRRSGGSGFQSPKMDLAKEMLANAKNAKRQETANFRSGIGCQDREIAALFHLHG